MFLIIKLHLNLIVFRESIHERHPFKPTYVVDHDIYDWKGNSSLGQASFRSRKSMQTRIFSFFLVTRTILATQSGCCSSLMKPESISVLTFDWITSIISEWNYRCCYLTGFASRLMLKWCIALEDQAQAYPCSSKQRHLYTLARDIWDLLSREVISFRLWRWV